MSDPSAAALGIALAFGAGLLSFASPCVLPLIPSYLTFVTGVGFEDLSRARRAAFVHALLFVTGFTLIFVALGASATVLGRVLIVYRVWIARVGGALIVLFGLHLLRTVHIAAFDRERRVHLADKPVGYLGTVLVGIAFGAGWTPCLGPILGAILTYTATTADVARGMPLLVAYSLGLALPFLVAAVAVERFLETMTRLRPHLARVSQISGAVLVIVGVLMMLDYFTALATYLQAVTPDGLRSRL
jgi:cytochrome c-type biogenesis protein